MSHDNWQVNKPVADVRATKRRRRGPLDIVSSVAVMLVGVCVIVAQGEGDHPVAHVVALISLIVGAISLGTSAVLDRRKRLNGVGSGAKREGIRP